jgi:benzoylformate decarboxylase
MMRDASRHVLLEMLVQQGVKYIFGNPGTTELPLVDGIQDHRQLNYILALQEGVAVAMADGYARASCKAGFVNLHIVGGLANGISMLYNAFRGGTPLVVTAGQSDTRMLMEAPVLTGNLVEMCRQYSKWSAELLHGKDVPTAIRRAFRTALTPPTGPVFLSLPWDVLDQEIEMDLSPPSALYARTRPDCQAVEKAVEWMAKARNPLMLVGDRVAQARAVSEAVKVAERLGAVVMAHSYSEVNFPTSHPQFNGILNVDSAAVRKILQSHDVIFAVGCNVFSQFLYVPDLLSGNEQVIHLDVDVREIEKNHPVRVGVWGDIKSGLQEIHTALEGSMIQGERDAARRRATKIGESKARRREAFLGRVRENRDQRPMDPQRLFMEIKEVLPRDAIIASEAVTSNIPLFRAMEFDEPGSFFGSRGGALGWGIGGPLGIKLAAPHRPVIGVVGDGSAMYSIQGLWSAVQYGLPVTYVVCNNRSYRILKHFLVNYYFPVLGLEDRKSEYPGMNFFDHPLDCAAVAEGFGVQGFRVDDPADLKPTLEKALGLGKPSLVDVHIHPGDF